MARPVSRRRVAEPEHAEYHEYRILCAVEGSHPITYASSMFDCMKTLRYLDDDCGPHRLERRKIERVEHPWERYAEDALKENVASAPDSYTAMHNAAQKKTCPKCHADSGEECFNLSIWRSSQQTIKQATSWPHAERLELL